MPAPRLRTVLACAALLGLTGCSLQPEAGTEAQAAPASSATASATAAEQSPSPTDGGHPLDRLPELPWDYDLQGTLDNADVAKHLAPETDPAAMAEALRTVVQLDWMYAERDLSFTQPDVATLRGLYRDVEHFAHPVMQGRFTAMVQENIDYAAAIDPEVTATELETNIQYPLYPGTINKMGGYKRPADQPQMAGYETAVWLGLQKSDGGYDMVPVLKGERARHAPTHVTAVYDAALHPELNEWPGFVFEHQNHVEIPLADGRTADATVTRKTALALHDGRWMVTSYRWKLEPMTAR